MTRLCPIKFSGTQTALLAKQLQGMRDGGTFILAVPPTPIAARPARMSAPR